MTERKYRLLLITAHPTQYSTAVFRRMAQDPRLDILVAYCSLQGARPGYDPGFGREVAWDIPLLDGYPWVELRNRSSNPRLERFWGLFNPSVWKLIRRGQFHAVVIYTGYVYATFWVAVAAAKTNGTALLFNTDAHALDSRNGRSWKTSLKRRLWPPLFRLADVAIGQSSGGVTLLRSLGLPKARVALFPYVVDNERWQRAAAEIDRTAARGRLGLSPDAGLVVYSAKLQPWKRPIDLLRAFARAAVPRSHLFFVGDGPLRPEIEKEITRLGLCDRVRLFGFVNQSSLPEIYCAADILTLPSQYEPFGVVVNEAMLCGCVPIVSDKVGARFDLVDEGRTGLVYPAGDVEQLAQRLHCLLCDPARLRRMREAARERISSWSPREYVSAMVEAVERAVARRKGDFTPPV